MRNLLRSHDARLGPSSWRSALGSARCPRPSMRRTPDERGVASAVASARRMPDGRQWTTENLNVDAEPSFCYENAEAHCRRYGRLYTWESAQRACRVLGSGWRLPTVDEWRQLAGHYGGVRGDSEDGGRAAYEALAGRWPLGVQRAAGRWSRCRKRPVRAPGRPWPLLDSIGDRSGPGMVVQLRQGRKHPQPS